MFVILRVMFSQYKNAHDKWYDINRDYKKVDKKINNSYDDPGSFNKSVRLVKINKIF